MVATETFTVGFRVQKSWGSLVALGLFFGGWGGGLFLVSLVTGFDAGHAPSLVLTLLGALFLLLHLRRPQQFWRAVSRPATSWISRGVISITLFVGLGIIYLIPEVFGSSAAFWSPGGLGQAILVVEGVLAILIVMYTGFILSTPPAIAFWHTALLPALFSLYSLSGGISFVYLWYAFVSGNGPGEGLQTFQDALLAAILMCVLIYLGAMSSSTAVAKESLRMLVKGEFSLLFLAGVILVGLVVPLALIAYGYVSGVSPSPATLAVVGLCDLIGGLIFRYTLLKTGLYAPVL